MDGTYEDIVTTQSRGRVQCTLCNVLVSDNDRCIETHIDGERHRGWYLTRLMIRNNIRASTDDDDDEVFCVICEESISNDLETVQYHLENSASHEEIRNLIVGEFLKLPVNNTDKPSLVRCTICLCYIGFSYYDIETHIDGRKHRLARAIAVKPLNGIFSVTNDDDKLWCKVCDEYIDNCVGDILDHVDEDETHQINFDEITFDDDICIEDYLTNVHQDKAFCKECNVWVPCNEYNLREHVEGNRHNN